MLARTKPYSIAIAVVLGIGVNVYLAIPAFSASPPSQVAAESRSASPLHNGDLVRVRSGGPLMGGRAAMPGNGQWFEENDPEGVAFEYDVIEMKATSVGGLFAN